MWYNDVYTLNPDALLLSMGSSAADNSHHGASTRHWLSESVGLAMRAGWLSGQYGWRWLENNAMVTPAIGQYWQNLMMAPVRRSVAAALSTHQSSDPFAQTDLWLESAYAWQLRQLVATFARAGEFQLHSAQSSYRSSSWQIVPILAQLALLEHSYHTVGPSRLAALKEMLKVILMCLTGQPLSEQALPYQRRNRETDETEDFDAYLQRMVATVNNLYQCDAFDLKQFSEHSPAARLGACEYRLVAGSELQGCTLRHYLPLPGVTASGRVLYLSSPLINKPEIFDLAAGKSLVECFLQQGHDVYLVDHSGVAAGQSPDLRFFAKTLPDHNLQLIRQQHPDAPLAVVGYCMGGTLMLPYLARRQQEKQAQGEKLDIDKLVLMTTPVQFDDESSGHKAMRDVIRQQYLPDLMTALFSDSNIPSEVIESGMHQIQPGVEYSVTAGFFSRAESREQIDDAAPFLNWLFHGTRFPAKANRQWIEQIFIGNEIATDQFCLPSSVAELDGQPVAMSALSNSGLAIFDYRGQRDPIAPVGSCIASEKWGCLEDNRCATGQPLNRTIERNMGHIFVVSRKHLADFMEQTTAFLQPGE
ncbi:alpha/beta fold hydrolase [Oceanobacter mangrovi]|uniref:alpha/beta fold hydrolase n=1 Tax=Oceanobacter mangrovi TaxID=2862510 RepID=UPI001C8D06E6|nr:alpha/beta fold hydrolase [Oceanobacter mangrovi]